jgi:hypothetical protein
VSKEIIYFKLLRQDELCHFPDITVSQAHFSNIPSFQLGRIPCLPFTFDARKCILGISNEWVMVNQFS